MEVVTVIAMCLAFTAISVGSAVKASLDWSGRKVDELQRHITNLEDELAKLRDKYIALATIMAGKSPEVSITAHGDLTLGEFGSQKK